MIEYIPISGSELLYFPGSMVLIAADIYGRLLHCEVCTPHVNTLRSAQNGWYFTEDILKCIYLNFVFEISLEFVVRGPSGKSHHGSIYGLRRQQAITWANSDIAHWKYALSGFNELRTFKTTVLLSYLLTAHSFIKNKRKKQKTLITVPKILMPMSCGVCILNWIYILTLSVMVCNIMVYIVTH